MSHLTITIGSPPVLNGREGRRELARFYCDLLAMRVVREDWLKIAKTDRSDILHFALDGDGWSDLRPPQWGDPDHPQQMHLDIEVADVAMPMPGATLLRDNGPGHRIYADPAGHPFCLRAGGDRAVPRVARLVIDCFSPRAVASFYEGLFGVERDRVEDTPERVVISLDDERLPHLAFQHAVFQAARWPDPAYPAQFHMDVRFADGPEAAYERAERLGAIRLPDLADSQVYADPAGHPFCL